MCKQAGSCVFPYPVSLLLVAWIALQLFSSGGCPVMGEGILAPQLPSMSPSLSLFGRSHDPALKWSLVSREKCLFLLFYALFIKLCTAWSCLCGLESILKNRIKWNWIKTIWALPLGNLHGREPPQKRHHGKTKQTKKNKEKHNNYVLTLPFYYNF